MSIAALLVELGQRVEEGRQRGEDRRSGAGDGPLPLEGQQLKPGRHGGVVVLWLGWKVVLECWAVMFRGQRSFVWGLRPEAARRNVGPGECWFLVGVVVFKAEKGMDGCFLDN